MQKLLGVVLPSFLEAVRGERERQVVMGVLEAMNAVLKACQGEALQSPGRLQEISQAIRDVLKKRVSSHKPSLSALHRQDVPHLFI